MNAEINKEVAKTILSQLGGKQFLLMTHASKLVYGNDQNENSFLQFNLPLGGFNKNNYCRVSIILDYGRDTYIMVFYKKKLNHESNTFLPLEVKRIEDVYCDNIQDIFELETNLLCTLYPRATNQVRCNGLTGNLYSN